MSIIDSFPANAACNGSLPLSLNTEIVDYMPLWDRATADLGRDCFPCGDASCAVREGAYRGLWYTLSGQELLGNATSSSSSSTLSTCVQVTAQGRGGGFPQILAYNDTLDDNIVVDFTLFAGQSFSCANGATDYLNDDLECLGNMQISGWWSTETRLQWPVDDPAVTYFLHVTPHQEYNLEGFTLHGTLFLNVTQVPTDDPGGCVLRPCTTCVLGESEEWRPDEPVPFLDEADMRCDDFDRNQYQSYAFYRDRILRQEHFCVLKQVMGSLYCDCETPPFLMTCSLCGTPGQTVADPDLALPMFRGEKRNMTCGDFQNVPRVAGENTCQALEGIASYCQCPGTTPCQLCGDRPLPDPETVVDIDGWSNLTTCQDIENEMNFGFIWFPTVDGCPPASAVDVYYRHNIVDYCCNDAVNLTAIFKAHECLLCGQGRPLPDPNLLAIGWRDCGYLERQLRSLGDLWIDRVNGCAPGSALDEYFDFAVVDFCCNQNDATATPTTLVPTTMQPTTESMDSLSSKPTTSIDPTMQPPTPPSGSTESPSTTTPKTSPPTTRPTEERPEQPPQTELPLNSGTAKDTNYYVLIVCAVTGLLMVLKYS